MGVMAVARRRRHVRRPNSNTKVQHRTKQDGGDLAVFSTERSFFESAFFFYRVLPGFGGEKNGSRSKLASEPNERTTTLLWPYLILVRLFLF